jgi:hypothetical protein
MEDKFTSEEEVRRLAEIARKIEEVSRWRPEISRVRYEMAFSASFGTNSDALDRLRGALIKALEVARALVLDFEREETK